MATSAAFVARILAQPAGVIAGQQAAQAAIQAAIQQARDRAVLENAPSYVGAARRTTRQAPARTVDVRDGVPGCIQVVDAYGRIGPKCP
jgi:hypothetical protein